MTHLGRVKKNRRREGGTCELLTGLVGEARKKIHSEGEPCVDNDSESQPVFTEVRESAPETGHKMSEEEQTWGGVRGGREDPRETREKSISRDQKEEKNLIQKGVRGGARGKNRVKKG